MLEPFASLFGTVMRVPGFLTDQIGKLWFYCFLIHYERNGLMSFKCSCRKWILCIYVLKNNFIIICFYSGLNLCILWFLFLWLGLDSETKCLFLYSYPKNCFQVLLQLDPFLNELTSMFERSNEKGSVWVTLKRCKCKFFLCIPLVSSLSFSLVFYLFIYFNSSKEFMGVLCLVFWSVLFILVMFQHL